MGRKYENKRSLRFNNERTARRVAKQFNGEFKDLRNDPNAKSKFKVSYEKQDARNFHKQNPHVDDDNFVCDPDTGDIYPEWECDWMSDYF